VDRNVLSEGFPGPNRDTAMCCHPLSDTCPTFLLMHNLYPKGNAGSNTTYHMRDNYGAPRVHDDIIANNDDVIICSWWLL